MQRALSRTRILILFLVLAAGCSMKPRESVGLAEEFSLASDGRILSARTTLDDSSSRSFIKYPRLVAGFDEPLQVPESGLGLVFYCSYPLPSELVFQASASQEKEPTLVEIAVNGKPFRELELATEGGERRLALETSWLKQGQNLIEFSGTGEYSLERCQVREVSSGRNSLGATTESAKDQAKHSNILLPFGKPLEFTWQASGTEDETFSLEGIEEWLKEGVPFALAPPFLEIRLQAEDGELNRIFKVELEDSLQIPLPASLQRATLTLVARAGEKPVLGQNGLRVLEPRFERSVSSAPDPSPENVVGEKRTIPEKRPNVLVFMVDTLRADHLSCYGYPRQTSRNFDNLAQNGVLFEDVTAQSPWTKPSTVTLLTGLHPLVHGATDFGDKLPQGVDTLGEIFRKQGYRTGAFSANVFASDFYGVLQGFDNQFTPQASAPKVIGQALAWLDKDEQEEPFFLYVHTIEPHHPYAPPERFRKWGNGQLVSDEIFQALLDREHRREPLPRAKPPEELLQIIDLYDGEVLAVDASFGNLLQELKKRGLYENTIVALVSDHGEEFLEHGGLGHISHLYQELVQVPWIMRYPQDRLAGRRQAGQWQHLDFAPSILKAAGLPIPEEMTGFAFDPVDPQSPKERYIYSHVHVGPDAPHTGQASESFLIDMHGLRKSQEVYLECYSHRRNVVLPRALYNLQNDPKQLEDLYTKKPTMVAFMRRKLAELKKLKPLRSVTSVPTELLDLHLQSLQYLR